MRIRSIGIIAITAVIAITGTDLTLDNKTGAQTKRDRLKRPFSHFRQERNTVQRFLSLRHGTRKGTGNEELRTCTSCRRRLEPRGNLLQPCKCGSLYRPQNARSRIEYD